MIKLPCSIQKMIENETYNLDDIGMSDSDVYLFEDKVLKVQDESIIAENEYQMMKWLEGRSFTPKVLAYEKENGKSYLLMSKIRGGMSCDDRYMDEPELLIDLLAKAMLMLWDVDVVDCPSSMNLDRKLELAKYNVEHNLVDLENVQPDTFGENGFKDPQELLDWLVKNRPEEDLVLSHGDFCMPNVFFMEAEVSGVIDLGHACVADRYQDIALCYRSLVDNFSGRYGGKVRESIDVNRLFQKLAIEPDWEKIRYYILLDELF